MLLKRLLQNESTRIRILKLGETREQIQLLNTRLEELRNEKQQLFLRLKKVLNEDENRKRQQQQKDRYFVKIMYEWLKF